MKKSKKSVEQITRREIQEYLRPITSAVPGLWKAFNSSPTAVKFCKLAMSKKVGIRPTKLDQYNHSMGTYTDTDRRTPVVYIDIGEGIPIDDEDLHEEYIEPVTRVLEGIIHEFYHATIAAVKDPQPGESRSAFIRRAKMVEANAIMVEVIITMELLKAGYHYRKHELIFHTTYKEALKNNEDPLKAFMKLLDSTYTSDDQKVYPEYYGDWYDAMVSERHKSLQYVLGEKTDQLSNIITHAWCGTKGCARK
jgi:hypothetical protein